MYLILLCHGSLREYSSFDLNAGQTVQYRGNYGTPLSLENARVLVQTLQRDPFIRDRHLGASFLNYTPQDPLVGRGTFAPDINLSGDDNLPTFLYNLATADVTFSNGWTVRGRHYLPLRSSHQARLSDVVREMGAPCHLNLLCCTIIEGTNNDLLGKTELPQVNELC
jgi:hypothetical protein